MKLLDGIKYCRKEWVHRNYSKFIKDFKDYKKITKEKMVNEILKLYDNPKILLEYLSYKELKFLEKIVNNKRIDIEKNIFEYHSLIDKFIIIHDFDKGAIIPDEIIDNVKLVIRMYDKDFMQNNDYINDILIGMLKIYGFLVKGDIIALFEEKGIEKENIIEYIENNRYLNLYYYKYGDLICYEPYYYFDEELLDLYEKNAEKPLCVYNIEDYIYMRYNIFDLRNESIKKFFNELEKLKFYTASIYESLIKYTALDLDRESLKAEISSIPVLKDVDLSNIFKLMDEAMDEMCSPGLNGYSKNDFKSLEEKNILNENYEKNYERLIKEKDIIKYKDLRIKSDELFMKCATYITLENVTTLNKFKNIINKNRLFILDEAVINNLVTFHSINNEPTLFDKFIKDKLMVLSKDYYYASQIKESFIESIFEIMSSDITLGKVTVKDIYTNKEYSFYDIALANCGESTYGNYIYTSLITIDDITFSTGYGFVFIKDSNKDILKKVENIFNTIKGITNSKLKMFIACYKLSQKENVNFTHKVMK